MWCSRIRSDPLHCLSIRGRWILMHAPDWCRLIPLVQIVADLTLNLWGMLWFEFNFWFLWDLTAIFSMSWCLHIWCNMGPYLYPQRKHYWCDDFHEWNCSENFHSLVVMLARHTLSGAMVCYVLLDYFLHVFLQIS